MPRFVLLLALILLRSTAASADDGVPAPSGGAKPDCAGFEGRGAMQEVVVTGDGRPDAVPVYDVRLRYPKADTARYDPMPSATVADAVLVTIPSEGNANGALDVMFHDRKSIDEIVPIDVSFRTRTRLKDVPAFVRGHSVPGPGGLTRITGTVGMWQRHGLYVNGALGGWQDMITCGEPGAFPVMVCEQEFDYRHVDVHIAYKVTDLANWRAIRTIVERYLACAYLGDTQVNRPYNPMGGGFYVRDEAP